MKKIILALFALGFVVAMMVVIFDLDFSPTNETITRENNEENVAESDKPEENNDIPLEKIGNDLAILAEAYDGLLTGYEFIEDDLSGIWIFVSDDVRITTDGEKENFVSGVGFEVEKIITSNTDRNQAFVVFRYQTNRDKLGEYFNGKTTLE